MYPREERGAVSAQMITELSSDESLELDIEFARKLVVSGQTPEIRHAACTLMTLLIGQRSAARVRQMEIQRGLIT